MRRAIRTAAAGDWPVDRATGSVRLEYEERHRRRLRVTTDSGEDILLDLKKAALLCDGDGLLLDDDCWIRVDALPEEVVEVRGVGSGEAVRLAWHLGNRHIPVQLLEDGGIRFREDHVIESMVVGLGGKTERRSAPFTPESGAYDHHAHHDHHEGER